MARRRHQKGSLDDRNGKYSLRHWETVLQPDGTLKRKKLRTPIGQSEGKGKMTKAQAWGVVSTEMIKTNRRESRPIALMPFEDYYLGPYQLHLSATSKNFQATFRSLMTQHILPAIGPLSFRQITKDHIQLLVNVKKAQGLSPATVRKIRQYISMVYAHARQNDVIDVSSPAEFVKVPKLKRVRPHQAMTAGQAAYGLSRLAMPFSIMLLLGVCTSLGPAETTALKWQNLNLEDADVFFDGERLPARSAKVSENWTRAELKDTKNEHRERVVPLPDLVIPMLREWRAQSKFPKREDFVFAAQLSKTGQPVNANDANKYQLKDLSGRLDMRITWYTFRHTFATLFEDTGGKPFHKKCLMGHSREVDIADGYTHTTFERLREIVNAIGQAIAVELTKTDVPQKVVMIR